MKRQEASYTVELALLLPVILYVLLSPVYTGYDLYKQTKQASVSGWDQKFCADEQVRGIIFLGTILEERK